MQEKIEEMFASSDPDLWELAKTWCEDKEIDYYESRYIIPFVSNTDIHYRYSLDINKHHPHESGNHLMTDGESAFWYRKVDRRHVSTKKNNGNTSIK